MKLRALALLTGVVLLHPFGVPSKAQAANAPASTSEVRFDFARPGLRVPKFTLVVKDDGTSFYTSTSNAWNDVNYNGTIDAGTDTDAPICYVRSGTASGNVDPTTSVTFHVDSNPGSIRIMGSATIGGGTVTFAAVTGTYNAGAITANLTGTALPSVVTDDTLDIKWKVSINGGAWQDAGESKNKIYITRAADLSTNPLYQTVFGDRVQWRIRKKQ